MNYVGLDIGLAGLQAEPWGGAQSEVMQGDNAE